MIAPADSLERHTILFTWTAEVNQGIFSTSTGFLTMFIFQYYKLQLLHNKGLGRAQK